MPQIRLIRWGISLAHNLPERVRGTCCVCIEFEFTKPHRTRYGARPIYWGLGCGNVGVEGTGLVLYHRTPIRMSVRTKESSDTIVLFHRHCRLMSR